MILLKRLTDFPCYLVSEILVLSLQLRSYLGSLALGCFLESFVEHHYISDSVVLYSIVGEILTNF
jgi:hypothetical protein